MMGVALYDLPDRGLRRSKWLAPRQKVIEAGMPALNLKAGDGVFTFFAEGGFAATE